MNTLSSQRESERRLTTVMFVDISGFTAMSEKMDPEELTRLIDRGFVRNSDVRVLGFPQSSDARAALAHPHPGFRLLAFPHRRGSDTQGDADGCRDRPGLDPPDG